MITDQFHYTAKTVYYFQLEVKYLINLSLTSGHVLLSSCTTTAGDSLCSQRDDGTTQYHHTSVSCSSKVCRLFSFIPPNLIYVHSAVCAKTIFPVRISYNHVFIMAVR